MMFDEMTKYGHEEVLFCADAAAKLKAIIAIHNTTLGPAIGGTRRWVYKSEEAAIRDALRLSRTMTYKFAVSGCNAGGGKIVMLVDSMEEKSEATYRALGRFIEGLNGGFTAGADVGTSTRELKFMRAETEYVAGIPDECIGLTDVSPQTAMGVFQGIRACLNEVFGNTEIAGKVFAIQGLGNVGSALARLLHESGGKLIVTDVDDRRIQSLAKDLNARIAGLEEIYDVQCDVFSPCALGGILNDQTIRRLKCKIVAGAANNQLLEDRHGDHLHERAILYAPDFVINAGGAIYGMDSVENPEPNVARAERKVLKIYEYVAKTLEIAKECGIPTYKAAESMAEERINEVRKAKKLSS